MGLPSTAIMLFNRPIRGLLPLMNRELININNDDTHYETLEAIQKYNKDNNTAKDPSLFCSNYSSSTLGQQGALDAQCVMKGQWQQPQGTLIKHPGHEERQAHYTQHKHTCSTTISSEQYLCVQIKKVVGLLEDIFMLAVLVEPIRPPIPHAPDKRMEATQSKDTVNREGGEEQYISQPKKDSKTTGRHNRCEKQQDCTLLGD